MNDVNTVAHSAYSHGMPPIDWAIWLAHVAITTRDEIVAARQENPAAYPIFQLSLETDAVARRIIGDLLDAGWTPPQAVPK